MNIKDPGAKMTTKGGLTVTEFKTPCPMCGLVAEGVRCPRCNTLKIAACGGSCKNCKVECK